MQILLIVLNAFGFFFSLFKAYAFFHVVRWLLLNVNGSRVDSGSKPWSDRFVFLVSLFTALSFVI